MFYWPRPTRLNFHLSRDALLQGCSLEVAELLRVDLAWSSGTPNSYMSRDVMYRPAVEGGIRDWVIEHPHELQAPQVVMLGDSHLGFLDGSKTFSILREMADIGYLATMSFAVLPWDKVAFKSLFSHRSQPVTEKPVLQVFQ